MSKQVYIFKIAKRKMRCHAPYGKYDIAKGDVFIHNKYSRSSGSFGQVYCERHGLKDIRRSKKDKDDVFIRNKKLASGSCYV